MVARVAVAVTALLALAWLGVLERDARLHARGAAALRSEGDRALLARAEHDLRRANLMSPGTEADISRALVRRALGRTEQSVALVEDVLRREPDNLMAWAVLAVLSRGKDPEAVRRALAARQRLDPVNARRR